MNAKELAARLDRCEYREEIDMDTEREAALNGLVVVFGASDDLMEFRGSIHDEIGCYGGETVTVDAEGLQPSFDELVGNGDKDALRRYFKREGSGKEIEAVWDDGEYSWSYKTTIPHSAFEVLEDGEKYCLGIVFSLADAT